MAYNCIVLVKQVPDTKRITGWGAKVMNEDGTINRSALPAIFNPEDLNALELALQIKDRFSGRVTAITMGPPSAVAVLRECLFRGADDTVLITDPRCAASDTLATSYILSCAVKKFDYDIVLCGRQAIDGDTAQVGPQVAEKLGIPQITYVEKLVELSNTAITVRRATESGWQLVKTRLPCLLTVTSSANEPRYGAAKKIMKYKNATPVAEQAKISAKDRETPIKQWNLDFLRADLNWCGRRGSPTKVHRIQSVVLKAKESKTIEPTDQAISNMIQELVKDKIIL